MTAHQHINGFLQSLKPDRRNDKATHAVADAIGCPEWTSPEGCNRSGECFCKTAALRVAAIIHDDQSKLFWEASQ